MVVRVVDYAVGCLGLLRVPVDVWVHVGVASVGVTVTGVLELTNEVLLVGCCCTRT